MTIKECIDQVDNVKPNQYGVEEKVEWLSYLDGTILNDVLLTHEGYDGRYDDFIGYSPDKLGTNLIVGSPYDRLYVAYLKMKIDEGNGETARYNNSATLFNSYLLEYKKWYNKTHMPLHNTGRRKEMPANNNSAVTEAQLENIKRELLQQLREDITEATSRDKVHDVVMEYVAIHGNEFFGKDGADGKDGEPGKDGANGRDGQNGTNGKSAYEYAVEGGFKGTESEFMQMLADGISGGGSTATIGEVRLPASSWRGSGSLYSQVVNIAGVTANSQVDLTPSVEQLVSFYEKDISFVTENDGGVVTVYVIGQKPTNDYTIQVTITEVL